jgi:type IV secretion system protein VirB5
VTGRGARFLSQYARDANPFGDVGTRTISVQVTSVVRASDRSFQVKWTEREYERGNLAGTSRWTAILSVTMRPPESAETLRKNPLGLYVDAIDWSRELDTAPADPVAAPAPPPPSVSPNLPLGSPLDPGSAAQAAQPNPSTRNNP